MSYKVSVLIPTLGERKQELIRLLDSLCVQKHKEIEVIIVSQEEHSLVDDLCRAYTAKIDVKHLSSENKGLSIARNIGMQNMSGDLLVLADDDCWYDSNALSFIADFFEGHIHSDILLTQIYDPELNVLYKKYPAKGADLTSPREVLSKSSIEIAMRVERNHMEFDENFGLGARYISGEENDFLIRALKKKMHIHYEPKITVFHGIKPGFTNRNQIVAKGALYSKHFGFLVSNLVLIRDLLIKHQNNYKWFWKGYFDYKSFTRSANNNEQEAQ